MAVSYHLSDNSQKKPEFLKSTRSFSPHAKAELKAGRWDYFFAMLRDPATDQIPPDIRQKELQFARTLSHGLNKLTTNTAAELWKEAGPVDVGGRTRALAVDITNPNTIIAGGASGGIWKSTNNGESWQLKSTPSQILGITSLAQDPRPGHTDTWYCTTGEFDGSAGDLGFTARYYGNGIYKSTDNGESWQLLPSSVSPDPTVWSGVFSFGIKIVVNPVNGSVFIAANGMGIFRSEDGGNTFTLVLGGILEHIYSDVDVASNGTLVAAISSPPPGGAAPKNKPGIYRSINNGLSWAAITPNDFPQQHLRSEITLAPSNPNTLYVLTNTGNVVNDRETVLFYRINVSNGSYENRSQNLPDFGVNRHDYIFTQRNYNMTVAVKPDNENFVLIGATSLFRSFDGFATKLQNAKNTWIGGYHTVSFFYPNLHPDIHSYAFDPTDPNKMWWGHDGGLSYTEDIRNTSYQEYFPWRNKNKGYNVTQFYAITLDQHTTDNYLMGGTQDNGTPYFSFDGNTCSAFTDMSSGDGAYAYFAKNFAYTSRQNGSILRLTYGQDHKILAGGEGPFSIISPKDAKDQLFINPFAIDPKDENVMFYPAGSSMWRNTQLPQIPDYENNTSFGWQKLNQLSAPSGYIYSAMEFSTTNPEHLLYYALSSRTAPPRLYKLTDANVSTSSAVQLNIPGMASGSYIHDIAVNPDNGNELLVVLSNYNITGLFHSSDGGATFTAVEGNLTGTKQSPGPSIRSAAILQTDNSTLYIIGCSIGIFSTTQLTGDNTVWIQEGGDIIGNTVVNSIAVRKADGKIVAGTHGRGAFCTNVSTSGTAVINIGITKLEMEAKPGNTASAEFTLSNKGTADLNYNISASGGSTELTPRPQITVPWQNTRIRSEYPSAAGKRTPGRTGPVRISGEDLLILDDGDDNADTFIGYGSWTEFSWANQFDLTGYGFELREFMVYLRTENAVVNSIFYTVYNDSLQGISTGAEYPQLAPEGGWFTIKLNQPVTFEEGRSFYIRIDSYNLVAYPAGYDTDAMVKNKSYFIQMIDQFVNMNTVSGFENGAYLIRASGRKVSPVENQPPIAVAQISKLEAVTGESISFDASQSYDPDGQIASYKWEFGDGQESNMKIAAHIYNSAGKYPLSLTVWDNKGESDRVDTVITVTAPGTNKPPVAVASVSKTQAQTGEEITFDASASYDPDGTIDGYSWSFGDGQTANNKTEIHKYSSAGKYTYVLKVTDNKGATDETSAEITITDTPSRFTVVPEQGKIKPGESAIIKVSYNSSGLAEGVYHGQLIITSNAGNITLPISININSSVFVRDNNTIPASLHLSQNFPNPFNSSTVLVLKIPESANVIVEIYDVNGRLISTLQNGKLPPGEYRVIFNAGSLPSGVYFCRMKSGRTAMTRKIVLLK